MFKNNKIVIIFLTIALCTAEKSPKCDFYIEEKLYVCENIKEYFPHIFYGNYNLKCKQCDIKTFSKNTFAYENSLVSFNVSDSGIQYLTAGAFSKLGNIQYLDLQNNMIVNVSKDSFAGLRQVYQINLQNNFITDLKPGFFNDLEANSVSLAHNKIKILPENAFRGLLGLQTLSLNNNEINTIHPDTFENLDALVLEYLELQNNKICHLPLGVFRHLQSVRVLNLANNKFTRFPLGTFSGLRDLNSLILANNSIEVFEGTELLPLNRLTTLDISGNQIYYLDSLNLYSSAPSLRYLRLEDNLFSCPHLVNVLKYLKEKGVDTTSMNGRFHLKNVNGIACIDDIITTAISFKYFLKKAEEETKSGVQYC